MSIARGDDELVVSEEMAELAERQGVHLHAGERVRFVVVRDADQTTVVSVAAREEPPSGQTWPPAWVGSIKDAEPDLATNFRQIMRDEITNQ